MENPTRQDRDGNGLPVRAAGAWRRRVAAAVLALSLAGCGGGGNRLLFFADIPSDRAVDGFVTRTVPAGAGNTVLTVIRALDNVAVRAEIDPVASSETRAFLDFPLDAPGGVPAGSDVATATLHVFVNRIDVIPVDTPFPIAIEIVSSFPPLDPSDFDAPATSAVTVTPTIFPSVNRGNFVDIDVAPLLRDVITAGVRALRLRIRPGLPPPSPWLLAIEDNVIFDTAPRLQVQYFPP